MVALSAVFGLSGCGLVQQYQSNKQNQEIQNHISQFQSEDSARKELCKSRIDNDARLDPLRSHINLSSESDSSIQQLASTKKPTANEKKAILAWDEVETECVNAREALIAKYSPPPEYVQVYRSYVTTQKQNRANLWGGKFTYGEYIKASQDAKSQHDKSTAAVRAARTNQRMQAEMQQAQINAVNAQAAAAVISAQAQQQSANAQTMMMFNQAQQQRQQFNAPGTVTNPVQTNCNRIGNSVNCQTYSY